VEKYNNEHTFPLYTFNTIGDNLTGRTYIDCSDISLMVVSSDLHTIDTIFMWQYLISYQSMKL
jgi:hypothetical protein